jgi:CTP:molybdopterin cytidylyltransferase MocA
MLEIKGSPLNTDPSVMGQHRADRTDGAALPCPTSLGGREQNTVLDSVSLISRKTVQDGVLVYVEAVTDRIVGVLLAAGASSRMGAHKLLLELGDEVMVRRVARIMLEGGLEELIVVLGREPDAVRDALEGLTARFVHNPDAVRLGMESSFRTALDAFRGDETAAVFALADQPFVTPVMISSLISTHLSTRAPMVASRFGGVIAPPHLFSRAFFDVLGKPGHGLKPLIQNNLERVTFLDWPEDTLFDVDTPDDLERARARILGESR